MTFKKKEKLLQSFERILFQVALAFIVLLFVGQTLMSYEEIRLLVSRVDQLEGEEIETPEAPYQDAMARETIATTNKNEYYIILEKISEKDELFCEENFLKVHVNQKPAEKIKDEPLYIKVMPGDLITIEGNWDNNEPVNIAVKETHDKVLHPHKGYSIYTFGEGEILGWVVMDED